jgi:hypothetical protein
MTEDPDKTRRPHMTPDRLRHEIDTGQTGDKVDNPDPAIAPLGTDEEAGGGRLVVTPDDIRRVTSPPAGPRDPERASIWGSAPLYLIIGFVALGLTFGAIALLSGTAPP